MILRALIAWALAASMLAALSWWQWGIVEKRAIEAENKLATCSARVRNIENARERENEIPDDLGDFDIPDGWLLPN